MDGISVEQSQYYYVFIQLINPSLLTNFIIKDNKEFFFFTILFMHGKKMNDQLPKCDGRELVVQKGLWIINLFDYLKYNKFFYVYI